MSVKSFRIAVVAPGTWLDDFVPAKVNALAQSLFGPRAPEIHVHPQCFLRSGHFAGDDAAREEALVEAANDPAFDAVWIGRGGYGSCRIAEAAIARMTNAARRKIFLGYSDAGSLLAGLYRAGFPRVAHGPMATDIKRERGEEAISRALRFLVDGDRGGLEPAALGAAPCAAFNITILSQLLGTPLEPDLAGHILMLEEVSEHLYRIDRAMFHITSQPSLRRVAGIMLGRCSDIPENDRDFGETEEEIARRWCARSGIAYLGRADIGHDSDNKIVPFGSMKSW